MIRVATIALAAALVAVAPAWAADPPAAPKPGSVKPGKGVDPAPDKKADPGEKLICAREEQTDSFIPKRVCRTQAQIDELRRNAQQLSDDQQLLNGRPQTPGR